MKTIYNAHHTTSLRYVLFHVPSFSLAGFPLVSIENITPNSQLSHCLGVALN
jgi:hypothetical protein